jgi:hypothetical protein
MVLPDIKAPATLRTSNGTLERQGKAGTDLAIVPEADGARVISVIRDPSASNVQRYRLEGAILTGQSDGSVLIHEPGGGVVGTIRAPWAEDAHGRQLPTHYTIDRDTLIQSTDIANAAYPVAVDPTISFGWYIYVRYNKNDVQHVAPVAEDAANFGPVLCALTAEVPVVAAGCIAAVKYWFGSVAGTFKDAAANDQCVELRWTYNSWLVGWRRYNC